MQTYNLKEELLLHLIIKPITYNTDVHGSCELSARSEPLLFPLLDTPAELARWCEVQVRERLAAQWGGVRHVEPPPGGWVGGWVRAWVSW